MEKIVAVLIPVLIILLLIMPEGADVWIYNKFKNIKKIMNLKKFKTVICATTAFMVIAHLYAWVNGSFLYDTTVIYRGIPEGIHATDKWLGQFVWILDAGMNAPWLAGILATFFMIISVYCIVDVLEINETWAICLAAGLCATHSSIICQQEYTGGNYTGEIALTFACIAMWIIKRVDRHVFIKTVFAALAIALSAGMYGAYVSIVPSLMLLLLVFDIFNGMSGKDNWKKAFLYLFQFLAGMVLYYIILRVLLHTSGGQLSSYMGEDNLSKVSGTYNMFTSIPAAYLYIFKYYLNGCSYLPEYMALLLFAIMLTGGGLTLYWGYKRRKKLKDPGLNIPLLLLIIAILPMAINLIYVMACGQVHYLMIFTYVVPLLFFVKIMEEVFVEEKSRKNTIAHKYKNIRIPVFMGGLLSLFLYYSIVMGNAIYVHYYNMYEVSLSLGTRILDRIETCDGFNGTEQVVLLGHMQHQANSYLGDQGQQEAAVLDAFLGPGNPDNVNGLYWGSHTKRFLENILDSKLEYVHYNSMDEYIKRENVEMETIEELQEMREFPEKDSVKKIGDKIYVKFSDS